ncbi:MAG: NYN domain-containing protein [Giesbergeria sp.]|uniref:NYN domain-containing protein n=1 Tax=Giesbergeria sp. TaxID=2818473 RepID=UPI00262D28E1|nr:NYN domain-containing protein [Giesbergeria sp.]MDD2608402.1 NYN domain-containing protein [Giesbergeria sp.]
MKSALFIDFDNVYSALRRLDIHYAERFARQPLDWLHWLTDSLPLPAHAPLGAKGRRLLVRRCYFNPHVYQRFRPHFNRAGFETIDCPPMTTEGKTSTDIHMVLDMVELLQHETRFDEFIVFSADADFTPVLRKLRRSDRRTTVLAVGFPSAAYQASADLLIDTDSFVRDALGESDDPHENIPPTLAPAPSRYSYQPPAHHWMPPAELSIPIATSDPQEWETMREAATQIIRQEVETSDLAVPLARLASRLPTQVQGLDGSSWAGLGSFRRFIETLSLSPLLLDWSHSGGYLYDPQRHARPMPPTSRDGTLDSADPQLVRQICDATEAPRLGRADWRQLWQAIADDLAQQPFHLRDTGKRVRDLCRLAQCDISREEVNWVLRGLLMGGHQFAPGQNTTQQLAQQMAQNLDKLCTREELWLDENQRTTLYDWVGADC